MQIFIKKIRSNLNYKHIVTVPATIVFYLSLNKTIFFYYFSFKTRNFNFFKFNVFYAIKNECH